VKDIEKQLRKGVLDILILKLISEKDMYGYELMKELDERSQGYYKLKEGSLYPVLYRLEDALLVENYRPEETGKRSVPRKYYKITDQGRLAVLSHRKKWNLFVESSNRIIGG